MARFRPPVLLSVLVSVIAVSLTGSLQAAPMTSDVQAIISLGPPVNALPATAAAGPFPGNDKPTDLLNRLNNLNLFGTGITTWTLIGSSDEVSNGPFDSNPSTTSGQILLDNPINGPFVIAVKGGIVMRPITLTTVSVTCKAFSSPQQVSILSGAAIHRI